LALVQLEETQEKIKNGVLGMEDQLQHGKRQRKQPKIKKYGVESSEILGTSNN